MLNKKITKLIYGSAITLSLLVLVVLLIPSAITADGGGITITVTAALAISNVSATSITQTGATISWNTDGNATSQVFYDTVSHASLSDYTYSTAVDTSLVMAHSLNLTGLLATTTYHYRAKSVLTSNGTDFISISDDYTFSTPASPAGVVGGGGGGGGLSPIQYTNQFGSIVEGSINFFGEVRGTIIASSGDNNLTFVIPVGTFAKNSSGQPISKLTVTLADNPPAAPSDKILLGPVYDLGQTGATFNPPITITMKYDPTLLPKGVSENSMILAYYEVNPNIWIPLENIVVDTFNHTVAGSTSHFTQFGILSSTGSAPTSIPTPTPMPVPIPIPKPAPAPTPTPFLPVTRNLTSVVNSQGVFTQSVTVNIPGTAAAQVVEQATLAIPKDSTGLTKDGSPLSKITVSQLTTILPLPSGKNIIGLPYNFGPDGAIFNPPAQLTLNYNPSLLPTGVIWADLVVAYWNPDAYTWIELEVRVDTNTNTIIVEVPHFTTFAIFARAKSQTVTAAAFELGSLNILPETVNVNQPVSIMTFVTNTGGVSGRYTVNLKVNDKLETLKSVMISGGSTREVLFALTRATPGTYDVDVNGLMGTFIVKAEEKTSNVSLLLIIGAAVFVVLSIIFMLWRAKKGKRLLRNSGTF